MLKIKKIALVLVALAFFVSGAKADCHTSFLDDDDPTEKWEIITTGTITGYIDENGIEQDGFEGCEYGRTLIVSVYMHVTCYEFNYSFSYRPNITIYSDGNEVVTCINGEEFNVRL